MILLAACLQELNLTLLRVIGGRSCDLRWLLDQVGLLVGHVVGVTCPRLPALVELLPTVRCLLALLLVYLLDLRLVTLFLFVLLLFVLLLSVPGPRLLEFLDIQLAGGSEYLRALLDLILLATFLRNLVLESGRRH